MLGQLAAAVLLLTTYSPALGIRLDLTLEHALADGTFVKAGSVSGDFKAQATLSATSMLAAHSLRH